MRIKLAYKSLLTGGAIIIALVICAIGSLAMAGYLLLIEQQNQLSARSQSWNISMAVVEAGIEEALEHLNVNIGNLTADGWSFDGTFYNRTRTLPDGNGYLVSVCVTNPSTPIILAEAQVKPKLFAQNRYAQFFADIGYTQPSSGPVVNRAVKASCRNNGLCLAAMVAKKTIDLNGNGVATDSFNSKDTTKSTNGQYDSSKAGDRGDIATNEGIVNAINLGNANIYGKVHTGPNGSVAIGPNGAVGTHAWQATHKGIQSGYFSQDANFTFPNPRLPYDTGLSPAAGTVAGTNYDHVLAAGDYCATSLSGNTIVTGDARLVLPNGFNMSTLDTINIVPGGSLTVYAAGTSCAVYGNGIQNQPGFATNFVLYCTETVTSFNFNGNGQFTGVMIIPNADAKMNGTGSSDVDIVGCLMANSITLNGHFKFHYDESLGDMKNNTRYLITSWDEIPTYRSWQYSH
jgi:hypothetical protein